MANTVYEIRVAVNSVAPQPQAEYAAQIAQHAIAPLAPADASAGTAELPGAPSTSCGGRFCRFPKAPWLALAVILAAVLSAHWSLNKEREKLALLEQRISAQKAMLNNTFKLREAKLAKEQAALSQQSEEAEAEQTELQRQTTAALAWGAAIERLDNLASSRAKDVPASNNPPNPENIDNAWSSEGWRLDKIQQKFRQERQLAMRQPAENAYPNASEQMPALEYTAKEVAEFRKYLRRQPLSIFDPPIHASNPALNRW